MPNYVLFREGEEPTRFTSPKVALDATYALPLTKRAVLCGERTDGSLAEAIVRVGFQGPIEAREWAKECAS